MISNTDFSQQSRFLTACRRLKSLVLPSIFDTSLSSVMMWNLQSYPTAVLNERMWHFTGSKHTLTTPTQFQVVQTPTSSMPLSHKLLHDLVNCYHSTSVAGRVVLTQYLTLLLFLFIMFKVWLVRDLFAMDKSATSWKRFTQLVTNLSASRGSPQTQLDSNRTWTVFKLSRPCQRQHVEIVAKPPNVSQARDGLVDHGSATSASGRIWP